MITLDDAIDLIPKSLIRKITSVELISESNNRAYKLLSDKREYFLRLDGPSAKHLGVDREKEVKIQKIAADAGFAPQILFEDYENGTFLTQSIQGSQWTRGDFQNPKKIISLVELLLKLHSLPLSGFTLNPSEVAHNYLSNITNDSEYYNFSKKCFDVIKKTQTSENKCFCHNDIHAANIIQNNSLYLLDWEYAYDNDPMFEIASISVCNNLRKEEESFLLDEYIAGSNSHTGEGYQEQKRLFEAINFLWLVSYQSIKPARETENLLRAIHNNSLI